MENYFILKVNYNNNRNYLKVIQIITKHFTVKKKGKKKKKK